MPINADIQTLQPGDMVTLYEVDATKLGADVYRFHSHEQTEPIVWQGQQFDPWPVQADGFEMSGTSKQPTPSLRLANLEGFITALCLSFNDLTGAQLTRHRTLAKYLDGQPEADPNEHFPADVWLIERKTEEDNEAIQFEMSSLLDFQGQQLPRRQIIANTCSWLTIGGYRGPYCGYNGPPVADEFDIITTDASKDKCGGLVRSCKLRFGEFNELNYGSFAAAGLIR